MRICINCLLIEPGSTGGGETFLDNLVRKLARLDDTNEYLLLVTEENKTLFEHDNPRFLTVVLMRTARSRLQRIWHEHLTIPHLLRSEKIDLYYSPFGTLPPFLPCKSVVTFQNLLYLDFWKNTSYRGNNLLSWLKINAQAIYYRSTTRSTLRRADKIWAVSKTCAAALSEYYGVRLDKIAVIHEGVDLGHFHPLRSAKSTTRPVDSRYVLMVAALYPNKNIDLAIRAFRRVVDQGLPHKLLIVGNDWHRYSTQLEHIVHELNLKERVQFVGGVDHASIPTYFQHADLFLMLSNVESFGLPVLEAMASGVPVIISDRSSLPEIAGNAAITADIRNIGHISDQIIRVLTDRMLSTRLRERGWNRARDFDWNETAARAIDLFNSLRARLDIPLKQATKSISQNRLEHRVPTSAH